MFTGGCELLTVGAEAEVGAEGGGGGGGGLDSAESPEDFLVALFFVFFALLPGTTSPPTGTSTVRTLSTCEDSNLKSYYHELNKPAVIGAVTIVLIVIKNSNNNSNSNSSAIPESINNTTYYH